MEKHLSYSVQNGIATITLQRMETLNSLNRQMALHIQAALDRSAADPTVRVVVLTGTGKAFCAGQDLHEMLGPQAPSIRKVLVQHHNPIVRKIRAMEKPVIAAVNGVAAGAGAVFALACDIVIASESAIFVQAFSKIGLTPGSGGTFFLPRLVGNQKASALLLLGNKIDAREAERIGMIYKWVPDAEFKAGVEDLALQLAKLPALSLALTKQALNQSVSNDLDTQIKLEDDLKCMAGTSADYQEGVSSFLEKRAPVFKTNFRGLKVIKRPASLQPEAA